MVIEKGTDWGHAGARPARVPTASSDAELAELVVERRAVEPSVPPVCSLTGGDLLATLGGRRDPEMEHWWYPLDLGWVETDTGDQFPFVAHVVARRWLWRGRFAVAMNAAWLGDRYLGPRAHPNDGLLDLTSGELPWRERLEAWRRARQGTHLPHPGLATERTPKAEWRFERPLALRADGVLRGAASHVRIRIQPDAFWVVL